MAMRRHWLFFLDWGDHRMKQPVKNFLVTIGLIVVAREIGGAGLYPYDFLYYTAPKSEETT